MSTVGIIVAVAAGLSGAVVLWGIISANSLVYKRNRIRQCRSGISIAMKQRNDLIPNLVRAVKAYMEHESALLTSITEMRSRTLHASEKENIEQSAELSALLSRLNVAVEHYPELKADSQFLLLQGQLTEMEQELQAIRRTYNAAVVDYNNSIEMFPSSLIASWKKYTPEELLAIPESELHDIRVDKLFRA